MEIFNEIKSKDDQEKQKFVHRSLADVQRAKLEKLMKNPDKPVIIPELARKDKEYNAPSFVRNVMGSSAGAGSGEFHVYRHLRRKEYARQKHLKMECETERLNEEYQQRLEDNQRKAEDKTSKKRAKRLKKKMKGKGKKKLKMNENSNEVSDKSEESEEEKSDEEGSDTKTEQTSDTKNDQNGESTTDTTQQETSDKEHQEDDDGGK
ncbi:CLUMA_CG017418, isoform A [Clunio marinus]|uniref:CLUMA_CG017418, isoform A n=1 Tax=Clunio marinus TaxID=568069 RepID=A0A1J1IVM8_9DIPT|nr:CLUMA_CG017418, isoform A [Clunio marinus]